MKPLVLFVTAAMFSSFAFAQKSATISSNKQTHPYLDAAGTFDLHPGARTTATGDTIVLRNTTATDTPTLYLAGSIDSGFVSGTDAFGDMGYAERYDFGTADSSLKVIGVIALFGGTVQPTSTKTVNFYTWNVGPKVLQSTSDTTLYESGLPNLALDSVNVPFTQLGIATSDTAQDTFKLYYFTTPTAYLNTSFFVGYTINYDPTALGGDTIGLFTTQNGDRTSPIFTVSGTDTIINNQNVTMYNDGSGWHDNATDNFADTLDFFIYPVAIVKETESVTGITHKGLTFYGAYPNPASNSTNIKVSLAATTDITVAFMDAAGRTLKTVKQTNLSAGDHILNMSTADLASGDYIYLVRTADGGGIASKLTIIK